MIKKGNFVSSRYATKQASQKAIVALAKKQVGKAYKSGGNTPAGFDCSGLTSYTYRKTTSKNIGRASYDQVDKGTYVKMNVKNLQAGDILFWGSKSNPYHVAIYIGNGKYIHSSTPATGVEYNNINKYKPSFAKRML